MDEPPAELSGYNRGPAAARSSADPAGLEPAASDPCDPALCAEPSRVTGAPPCEPAALPEPWEPCEEARRMEPDPRDERGREWLDGVRPPCLPLGRRPPTMQRPSVAAATGRLPTRQAR